MKKYGKTRSGIKPELIRFDEFSVWMYENISEIQTEDGVQYEYDMTRYSKDEYILMLIEKNTADTQYIGMMMEVL